MDFTWREAEGRLHIAARQGHFTGMTQQRRLSLRRMGPAQYG